MLNCEQVWLFSCTADFGPHWYVNEQYNIQEIALLGNIIILQQFGFRGHPFMTSAPRGVGAQ